VREFRIGDARVLLKLIQYSDVGAVEPLLHTGRHSRKIPVFGILEE
jgi:hypothetical protein